MERLYLSMLDIVIYMEHPQSSELFAHQCSQRGLKVTKIADIPLVLRIGPHHPLYDAPEISLSDFGGYAFVDYENHIYQDYPNLNTVLSIDPARVVTVTDRNTKNMLIMETDMYTIGCKLPPAANQRFRFRCIPLGDMHYCLNYIEREENERSTLVQRYLDILSASLEDL